MQETKLRVRKQNRLISRRPATVSTAQVMYSNKANLEYPARRISITGLLILDLRWMGFLISVPLKDLFLGFNSILTSRTLNF